LPIPIQIATSLGWAVYVCIHPQYIIDYSESQHYRKTASDQIKHLQVMNPSHMLY